MEKKIAATAYMDGVNDNKTQKKCKPCNGENFWILAKDFRTSNLYSKYYVKGFSGQVF
ncbi:hypothetical protein SDC9_196468 [bioreactor metagenome]|uniref:Uncharacterized protein n=1 Tax=bioreactor metagenome TaxID=1076179 RepID=A0A645ID62_9ZZZZ